MISWQNIFLGRYQQNRRYARNELHLGFLAYYVDYSMVSPIKAEMVRYVLNAALSKSTLFALGNHCESLSGNSQAIIQHIKASYEDGELEQNATCKSYFQVKQEGNSQVRREGYCRFATVEKRR